MKRIALPVSLCTILFTACARGPAREPAAPPAVVAKTMSCGVVAAPPKLLWTVDGLSTPESAVWDATSKAIYVSNIAGEATGKDGQGWISKVSPQGKLIQLKWATGEKAISSSLRGGLNAPKGIAVRSGILWVSDIDRVEGFQIATGKKKCVGSDTRSEIFKRRRL